MAGFLPRVTSVLMRPWVLALLWLMVLGYAVRFALFKLPAPPEFTDFNHFYVGALSLRLGSDPYTVKFDALAHSLGLDIGVNHISNQPPAFLLCFEPLTRLGPPAAYWTWTGISLISLVSALGLLLVSETSLAPKQMLLFCGLMFIYPPTYELLFFANTQNVVLLLIVVAMCCLRRGWNCGAGLSLAMAITLRAYPWPLAVYLVCRRQWRAVRWMVIGGALIGALTIWSIGPAHFLSFFDTWGFTTNRMFLAHPDDISLNAFVSRRFWPEGSASLSRNTETLRKAAVAAVELAVFVLTIAATIGFKPDRGWRSLSLWLVAMILLSPTAHGHYLVLLSVPFAAIAEAARQREVAPRVIYAAIISYLLAFSNYPLSFLRHYHWDSGALFHIATEYCFAAAAFAYLAAYWFADTRREPAAGARISEISAAAIPAVAAHRR
ncbi:MAG TPA: glycosyltransferase family 87 protein [Candidatus Binataceae bacterium]|nr:glycosyltransferase family 87 protein [Candidatus Binataceae bacterium]